MAKKYKSKYKSAVDGYKSKNRDRKRRGADIGSFLGAGISLLGILAMPSSKKKRKKSTNNRSATKSSAAKTNVQKNLTPAETLQGLIGLVVLGIIGAISIEIILNVGFKGFLIFIAVIIALFFAVVFFISWREVNQEEQQREEQEKQEVDENQILYLQSLLTNIDKYQAVINNSDNVNDVKKNLDWLLAVMDEIMSYDEETLRSAGMTKSTMPQQKEFVLKNYDIVLEQARERYSENHSNKEDISQSNTVISEVENIMPAEPLTPETDGTSHEPMLQENTDNIPSLESLIKVATPTKQGLYPHEILMLSYASTYKISENKFQGFWYYLYSVKEPQSLLTSLYERGFLTIGNLQAAIEKLKVSELKEELLSIGEKTTGKKAELVTRLLEKGNLSFLDQKYQDRYYALTEKGQQELNDNEYVPYLHKTKYISVWDMNYLLNNENPSALGYRDILWREFNTQSGEHFKVGNFGLYRNTRMYMYQFLMEENKYQSAFSMLCEVIAYDLSGLGNNEPLNNDPTMQKFMLEQTIKMGFPYNNSLYTVPPAIVGWMANIKELLNMNDNNFKSALLENFEKISLHRRIFTNEECVEIVMNEIGNHPRKQAAIYRQAEERLRAEFAAMK